MSTGYGTFVSNQAHYRPYPAGVYGANMDSTAEQDSIMGAQDVTLADPVALYIDSFTPVGFVTPDNADAKQFWKVTRGAPGFAVRAEFEVPASKNYLVGAPGPKRSSHRQCGLLPSLLLLDVSFCWMSA